MPTKPAPILPDPATRLPVELYLDARNHLLAHDPDGRHMFDWSRRLIGPPKDATDMAGEIIWIILCAGRSGQSARTIEAKVWNAIRDGRSACEGFGYRAKADAIDATWRDREADYQGLMKVIEEGTPEDVVDWCGARRYVGDDTKFQLAKNFGVDVCKPDIWLCRLAGIADKPRLALKHRFPACMALCRYLAQATNDSIAVIDSMLWLACNKGILTVDAMGGEISFTPAGNNRRSILVAAE